MDGRMDRWTDGQTDKVITKGHPPTSSGGALTTNGPQDLRTNPHAIGFINQLSGHSSVVEVSYQ